MVGVTAIYALASAFVRQPSPIQRLAMAAGLLFSVQGLVLLPRVLRAGIENLGSLEPICSLLVLAEGGWYLQRQLTAMDAAIALLPQATRRVDSAAEPRRYVSFRRFHR